MNKLPQPSTRISPCICLHSHLLTVRSELDLDEFCDLMVRKLQERGALKSGHELLHAAFSAIDVDKSGSIDAIEVPPAGLKPWTSHALFALPPA